jgi:hypothetical protein
MRIATSTMIGLLLAISLPANALVFTDNNYHQYILYNMDQTEIDVLILPSASPYALRDVQLMQKSVQAWEDGINNLGPAWLANGLNIHVYRVGLDPIPHAALWDPEIVVVPAEFDPVLLFGIGLEPMGFLGFHYCHGVAPPYPLTSAQDFAKLPGFHTHEGSSWGVFKAPADTNAAGRGCSNGGTTCFAINTNFLWTPDAQNLRDMYDLNSHEFGHCLGIGHVGDASDFTAVKYPKDDIMSYSDDGWNPGHVLCVSTLDIQGLEQVYGWLRGQTGYAASPADTYIQMAPASWSTTTCSDPVVSYLDYTQVTNAHPVMTSAANVDSDLFPAACPAQLATLC